MNRWMVIACYSEGVYGFATCYSWIRTYRDWGSAQNDAAGRNTTEGFRARYFVVSEDEFNQFWLKRVTGDLSALPD